MSKADTAMYRAKACCIAYQLRAVQGGLMELGAPTGRWNMIVIYRGKHCPVGARPVSST